MDSPGHSPELGIRIAQLYRSYIRFLRARPTRLEAAIVRRAATLQARAERVASDISASVEDVCAIDRLASKARKDLIAIVRARHKTTPHPVAAKKGPVGASRCYQTCRPRTSRA